MLPQAAFQATENDSRETRRTATKEEGKENLKSPMNRDEYLAYGNMRKKKKDEALASHLRMRKTQADKLQANLLSETRGVGWGFLKGNEDYEGPLEWPPPVE